MQRYMKASGFILFLFLSMIALMACSNALTQAELDTWFPQVSGGSVYYTARLEMKEKGLLRGQYFYAEGRELKEGMPMALEKIKE